MDNILITVIPFLFHVRLFRLQSISTMSWLLLVKILYHSFFRHVAIKLIDERHIYTYEYAENDQTILVAKEWHYCYVSSSIILFKSGKKLFILYDVEKCPAGKVTNVIERRIIAQYHHYIRLNVLYTTIASSGDANHTKLICNGELFLPGHHLWTQSFFLDHLFGD